MEHTPGPWVIKQTELGIDRGIVAAGGLIAEVFLHGGRTYDVHSPVEANAKLIAAAPETKRQRDALLEAAQSVHTWSLAVEAHGQTDPTMYEFVRLARAAIALTQEESV